MIDEINRMQLKNALCLNELYSANMSRSHEFKTTIGVSIAMCNKIDSRSLCKEMEKPDFN